MKIQFKILLVIILSAIFVNLFFAFYLDNQEKKLENKRLLNKVEKTSRLLQMSLVSPLWDIDHARLQGTIKSFAEDVEIYKIELFDVTGEMNFGVEKSKEEYGSYKKIETNLIVERDNYKLADLKITF